LFPVLIIVLAFAVGAYCYPQMPEQIVSHWNAQGVADGYMPKFWGIFLLPFMLIFLFLLFIYLPKIDPKKQNVEGFRASFDNFINVFFVFMFGIFTYTISWNLGYKFSIMKYMAVGFAIFVYFLAVLIQNAKMNWFVGIRTPWTLSSEKNWNDTHRLGGKLYKIAAAISLLGLISDKYAIFFVVLPLLIVSFYLVLFSYLEYKNNLKVKI